MMNEDRTKFLGGSDAAAALGLDPFRTPVELYLEKTGESRPDGASTIPLELGNIVEPYTLELFQRETGLSVGSRQCRVTDGNWSVRRATLDGVASDGAIVQAKSTVMSQWFGEPDTDGVPDHVAIQVHHEMMCTGARLAYVPVLFLHHRTFATYRVEFDAELAKNIDRLEREFWRRVETLDPPQPTCREDIVALYPTDSGEVETASQEMNGVHERLLAVTEGRKNLEEQEKELKLQLQIAMMDASVLVSGTTGRKLATWKAQTSRRFDQARFKADHPELFGEYRKNATSRIFRVQK